VPFVLGLFALVLFVLAALVPVPFELVALVLGLFALLLSLLLIYLVAVVSNKFSCAVLLTYRVDAPVLQLGIDF
jgi:hypothetical protein